MLVPTMQFEFLSSIASVEATTEREKKIPEFLTIYRQFQNSIAV